MHGYYRMSLTGSMFGLLADPLPVMNAATLMQTTGGVQAGCPEQGDYKVFELGKVHPHGRECCGIVVVLYITC